MNIARSTIEDGRLSLDASRSRVLRVFVWRVQSAAITTAQLFRKMIMSHKVYGIISIKAQYVQLAHSESSRAARGEVRVWGLDLYLCYFHICTQVEVGN